MSGCGSLRIFGRDVVVCRDHQSDLPFPCGNGVGYRWIRTEQGRALKAEGPVSR